VPTGSPTPNVPERRLADAYLSPVRPAWLHEQRSSRRRWKNQEAAGRGGPKGTPEQGRDFKTMLCRKDDTVVGRNLNWAINQN